MTHKWNTPYEWFASHIQAMDCKELYVLLLELASEVDPDTIQNKFRDMMDKDGYFEKHSKEIDYSSPYKLGYQEGCLRTSHTFGVPYSICPYRKSDPRRADWAYGYLDGLGHPPSKGS